MDLRLLGKYERDVQILINANPGIAVHAVVGYVFDTIIKADPAPQLIMEVGVGVKGVRTRAVCMAAALHEATLVGCDIKDCSGCGNNWYPKRYFVQKDGREFVTLFPAFCGLVCCIEPKIDVLIIDTDELYEQTREEIRLWTPYLRGVGSLLMLRCTNLQKRLFYQDGSSTMMGWDNHRGVVRAMLDELGIEAKFDETKEQHMSLPGWDVDHWPWGAGLTILRKTL